MLSTTQAEKYGIIFISYAGQLCKQAALGREEAEEHSHLTRFSKNTQVQNTFIFSYLIFS